MKTLLIALLIVAMSSCGPGAKLRRAKKLIAEICAFKGGYRFYRSGVFTRYGLPEGTGVHYQ